MMDHLRTDIRTAIRNLCVRPAIPGTAVLTTAVAVSINLAMLGLIDRALVSPPAHITEPQRVFAVGFEHPSRGGERGAEATTSYPTFEAMRDGAGVIEVAAAWHHLAASARIDGERMLVKAVAVSGEYFDMLGARPSLGRAITREDDRAPAGSPVAVLSHSLWKRAFAGDRQVIGRELALHDREELALRVVGVMPPGFSGLSADRVDLWLPLRAGMRESPGWDRPRSLVAFEVGVRLAAEATPKSASSHLATVTGLRTILWPIIGASVAPAPHRIAYWLAAVSLVVFMIGLANSATLLLVSGAQRHRERSIRSALGATRRRLLTVVFIESAILAVVAGGLALVLAYWLDELVRRLLLPSLIESSGINARVAIAAAAGSVCAFFVAAAIGALQVPSQVKPSELTGSRRVWRRATLQKELLIVQTTLAVLLIAGAGMFGRSYYNLLSQDFGMRIADVLVVSFEPGVTIGSEQDQFLTAAVERVRRLPGVTAVTLFGTLPHSGIMQFPMSVPGLAGEPELDGRRPSLMAATPELFDILAIPIVQGRRLVVGDDKGPPVVIVDETMAATLWPGTSPLGKCFRIGIDPSWDPARATGPPPPPAAAPCREVVGVARDVRGAADPSRHERGMHYYVPFSQTPALPPTMTLPRASGLLVRRASDDDLLVDAIRRGVTAGRTDLPFVHVRPYAMLIQPQMVPWQTGTRLLLLFGSIALMVAAVGICAAFAHAVAERRHEMAVRIAIGASRGQVLRMMLREGAAVAALGIMYGCIVAVMAGGVVRSMFVGTSSADPLVLGIAGGLMLLVAVLATWLPAHAAAQTDPNALLRSE